MSKVSRTRRSKTNYDEYIDEDDTIAPLPDQIHGHTDYSSHATGASVSHSTYNTPASPQKNPRKRPRDTTNTVSNDDEASFSFDFLDPNHNFDLADLADEVLPRKRGQGDHPLKMWLPFIDTYVQELLRLEGRGDFYSWSRCAQCGAQFTDSDNTSFQCCDCHDVRLVCQACILQNHRFLPLHHIKQWSGTHFDKVSLKQLGLRIQLGHPNGDPCSHPATAFNDDFVIVHTSGIHSVALSYCECPGSEQLMTQLLRARLYPATISQPKTAATFDVLKTFQLLSFMSKVSAYEFYHSLARLTDNTGTISPPDRYNAFLRMVRQWRHIRLLKRMGRGNDPTGMGGTQEGECAVLCPACPYPDINLPRDWASAPRSQRWMYSLFLGIDANFRLKRLNVSSDERDPGLNRGFAYIVEETKFKKHIKDYGAVIVDDVSTCNNHDALKSASKRGGKGISSSGAGTVECARHDMKRPLAVGDLQKGERYVNMDYMFLSSLHSRHQVPTRIVVSYDIACQWSRNIWKRINVYPLNLHPPAGTDEIIELVFVIPKFHLPAHQDSCRTGFSFNYTRWVANTDGEAPERGWASINAVAMSTKEMGPGSRRDTLDDHFGDYNWRKIITLAPTFLRKIKEAVEACEEQRVGFEEFHNAIDKASTKKWKEAVEAWEEDNSKPNPFVPTERAATLHKVRLALAEEEVAVPTAAQRQYHSEVSPSMMIAQGIDLEDHQRRLRTELAQLGLHPGDLQRAKLVERSNGLRRRVEAWWSIQELYMPSVARLRGRDDQEDGDAPQATALDLFLPSAILTRAPCDQHLMEFEWRLRHAQAFENLEDLRRHLLLRTKLYKFKDRFIQGQAHNLRSNTVIGNLQSKINTDAARYRGTYAALAALSGPLEKVGWQNELRVLLESDVRGLGEDLYGDGVKEPTWIWKTHGTGDGEEAMQEALRIEWCKARARAHRWDEECQLLMEEMRRVLVFMSWEMKEWAKRGDRVGFQDMSDPAVEGRYAYAARQVAIRSSMIQYCQKVWHDVPAYVALLTRDTDTHNV